MNVSEAKYTVEPSSVAGWKIHRNGEPITVQNAQATPMQQACEEMRRLASERDEARDLLAKTQGALERANRYGKEADAERDRLREAMPDIVRRAVEAGRHATSATFGCRATPEKAAVYDAATDAIVDRIIASALTPTPPSPTFPPIEPCPDKECVVCGPEGGA